MEGKRTHDCDTRCLVLVSSQSLLALSSRPISREKLTASSLTASRLIYRLFTRLATARWLQVPRKVNIVHCFRGMSASLVPRPPTVKRWKGSHVANKQVGSKVRDYMSPCAVVNTSPNEGLFIFTLTGGLPFFDVNWTHLGRACALGLITRALSFRTQVSLVSISAIYFQPATQEK